ncbi:52 kDa repressor of the inhibitor of the protein kinase-like [Cydia strobilella]|uniref:52 kDa repressor of the inhibitor of the protein kinase-like n=1 Tax=Cydia strobilella TaxID=1100964 RepID=UPI003004D33A
MPMYCAMYGCLSGWRNKERSFFRFPKDESRCRQWVIASGRYDFADKDAKFLYSSYYLCDLHFLKTDRLKKKLKTSAVPTQNLPQDYETRTKATQTEDSIFKQISTQDQDIDKKLPLASHYSQEAISKNSNCSTQTIKSSNLLRKRKLKWENDTESKKRKNSDKRHENAADSQKIRKNYSSCTLQ